MDKRQKRRLSLCFLFFYSVILQKENKHSQNKSVKLKEIGTLSRDVTL